MGNRCDLAVGLHDRPPGGAAPFRDGGVGAAGSVTVERQNAACEVLIHHRVDCRHQPGTSSARREDRHAGSKFSLGDRCKEKESNARPRACLRFSSYSPTCRLGCIRSCKTRTISTMPGSTAR